MFSLYVQGTRWLSSASASITRVHRSNYLLTYKTLLVNHDGSTYTIRHHEPKQIIKLPLDVTTLSGEEARARIERRRPKTKIKIQEETLTTFSSQKYLNLMKKKK